MHELSIIQQIVSTIDAELNAEEKQSLKNIIIHVGELSNVQPLLLKGAFEAFQQAEKKFTTCQFTVEQIPVEIFCDDCQLHSHVEKYVFRCQTCGRPTNHITKGEELLIHKLEFNV